jgi:hypothetical protein
VSAASSVVDSPYDRDGTPGRMCLACSSAWPADEPAAHADGCTLSPRPAIRTAQFARMLGLEVVAIGCTQAPKWASERVGLVKALRAGEVLTQALVHTSRLATTEPSGTIESMMLLARGLIDNARLAIAECDAKIEEIEAAINQREPALAAQARPMR